MSELTVLHNPRCSTSRAAMDQVGAAAVTADVVEYLKTPLDAAGLRELIAKLEDPVTDHPRLMQRPVLVKGDRAIIGRPKERVAPFINS
jgi:arsenate reductase